MPTGASNLSSAENDAAQPASRSLTWSVPWGAFAAASFTGSFLLFLIQPLAAKRLLPLFGGSASVWTASLLFFQTALFLGYAYAALATRRIHFIVLAIAAVAAAVNWTPVVTTREPVLAVFYSLTADIGAPFFVLAAGSTLLQRWAGSYKLYVYSNAGSLLALLVYPLLLEPYFGLPAQRLLWLLAGLLYVLPLMAFCVLTADEPPVVTQDSGERPAWGAITWWFALSACGSALLAATTNQLCQEVASIPFLWIAPLAIYLLSFILTFQSPRWGSFRVWSLLAPFAVAGAVRLFSLGLQAGYRWHFIGYMAVLLVCLMLCHGILARSRPPETSLGTFYVAISAGGMAGGLFAAVLAPMLFTTYLEFPILIGVAAALALGKGLLSEGLILAPATVMKRVQILFLLVAALIPLAVFWTQVSGLLDERRNFYGTLQVTERSDTNGPLRTLVHGQTIHGTQFVKHPDWPTTYYGENSGVARAIRDEQRIRPAGAKVGLIGLGAGTLAHYARANDWFRFYELNPVVVELSRKYFSYLQADQKIEIVLGDARVQLGGEDPQEFDILIVDAFSSDSIPVHLLTREAAQLYARHVKPEGAMLFHVSNRALNLEPVVQGLARSLHRRYELIRSGDELSTGGNAAQWIRLSPGSYEGPAGILWTDAYSSLWPILRIR